jgi:hypothetical protein
LDRRGYFRCAVIEEATRMKRLSLIALILASGGTGLALAGSAAGTTPKGASVRHLGQPVEAVAIDGSRIAYDAGAKYVIRHGVINKVLVWDVATGTTTKVSGTRTAGVDDSSTGAGVFALAIAGTNVAWMTNQGGNLEGDDALLTSSVTSPKEKQVATAMRSGENCPGREPNNCAGNWPGGLAGSGTVLATNRWTTDGTGAITTGGLYLLNGAKLRKIATGAQTVQAAAADGGRVAVLRSDGTVGIYASSGESVLNVTPAPRAREIALSGNNLVVLKFGGGLEVYNAKTGAPKKALTVHGSAAQADDLDVQGEIATYSTGCQIYQSCALGSIRAVNLLTGKDARLGTLRGGIGHGLAHIDSFGLAYAGNGWHSTYGKGTLVFVPFSRVAAAVS